MEPLVLAAFISNVIFMLRWNSLRPSVDLVETSGGAFAVPLTECMLSAAGEHCSL